MWIGDSRKRERVGEGALRESPIGERGKRRLPRPWGGKEKMRREGEGCEDPPLTVGMCNCAFSCTSGRDGSEKGKRRKGTKVLG